jgi:hypothetical protein
VIEEEEKEEEEEVEVGVVDIGEEVIAEAGVEEGADRVAGAEAEAEITQPRPKIYYRKYCVKRETLQQLSGEIMAEDLPAIKDHWH